MSGIEEENIVAAGDVAIDKLQTFLPFCIVLMSGSTPKLPRSITLFTEPAI